MLGWHVSVFRQTNEGISPATFEAPEGIRLAVWQTGLDGLDWIQKLVQEDRAIDLGGDGYPLRFTAKAENLLPPIIDGPPDAHSAWIVGVNDILTDKWEGKTVIDHAVIAECRQDEWLLVEAWDES